MDHLFLEYYNQELSHLRGVAKEFANEFPKIASRLQISDFDCEDPYVERLLEGFAFLTARVQKKMNDSFPRFTESILNTIFPIAWAPIPSMTIVELTPDYSQNTLLSGTHVPRGSSFKTPSLTDGQTPCEFRTAFDLMLWPIEITDFQYITKELGSFDIPPSMNVNAAIHIKLRNVFNQPFSKIKVDSLPFFINASDETATSLLEHIFADNEGLMIRVQGKDNQQVVLSSSAIEPIGYSKDEALLPNVERRFKGYRLFLEYFAFPSRFKFFKLKDLQCGIYNCQESEIELLILLNKRQIKLSKALDKNNLKLYCTPAVNLFPKHTDRIIYDKSYEYHVIADRTRPRDYEVYSIQNVDAIDENNKSIFGIHHFYHINDKTARQTGNFFSVHRRARLIPSSKNQRSNYVGSEVFISFSGPDFNERSDEINQIGLETLCTNRDLPLLIDPGTNLSFAGITGIKSARFIVHPSMPYKPAAQNETAWNAISHLRLSYSSLLDLESDDPVEMVKNTIYLYCPNLIDFGKQQIEGIVDIKTENVTRRLPGEGTIYFAQGLQVTITFDEFSFAGMGCFMLAYILKEFLTHFVSINSFIEVVIRTVQRGEIIRWEPITGIKNGI